MAIDPIVRNGAESISSVNHPPMHFSGGWTAGESYLGGQVLTMHADGLIYKAAVGGTPVLGVAPKRVQVGEAATYVIGKPRMAYSNGTIVKGKLYYLSSTVAGELTDTDPGGATPLAIGIDTNRIQWLI